MSEPSEQRVGTGLRSENWKGQRMNWTSGYVAEIDYTYGYYRELQPGLIDYALLLAGQKPIRTLTESEPLHYLELGYGQGLSLNIHAAASTGRFWGTDFNPSQAAGAAEMAQSCGSNLKLLDASFEELALRDDLPVFDVIALHGIWSWISEINRNHIVEIIKRHLRPGGVVYISYNCTPGWSAAMPLRHLLSLHAELAEGDAKGIVGKIDGALAFAKQVVDSGAQFFKANPAVAERLKKIADQNRNYLAHEYFNADWHPMPFSDLAAWLEQAKLGFAASAHLLDHVEAIHLPESGAKMLTDQRHPVLRETLRDYLVNQQFRRDLFVRGPRRLAGLERMDALRSIPLVLLTAPKDVSMKVQGALGEASLQESIYRPLIEIMEQQGVASNKGVLDAWVGISVADIEQGLKQATSSMSFPQLLQAITVLLGQGHLAVAQAEHTQQAVQARCDRLNMWIANRSREHSDIQFMASPVTGGGVVVSRFEQLFLLAKVHDLKEPSDQARWVWDLLQRQGQRLLKDGKAIESADENLAELARQAMQFADDREKRLKYLKIKLG